MSAVVLPPRRDPAFDLDERSMLTEFLDYHRATVQLKVAGLSDDDAWRRSEGDTVGGLLEAYAAQCERSREIAAGMQLDDVAMAPGRDGRRATLRWVLVRMIEETARHNGHLDLIREMTDGQTGE